VTGGRPLPIVHYRVKGGQKGEERDVGRRKGTQFRITEKGKGRRTGRAYILEMLDLERKVRREEESW